MRSMTFGGHIEFYRLAILAKGVKVTHPNTTVGRYKKRVFTKAKNRHPSLAWPRQTLLNLR